MPELQFRELSGDVSVMIAVSLQGAAYSSILAWKIPRTEEPGSLQSMGS